MSRRGRLLVATATVVLVAILATTAAFVLQVRHGLSARDAPTGLETWVAKTMRHFAVPAVSRRMENPVPLSDEVMARARAHFADHCALCHGNDGRGRTTIGQSLYPKAPDMSGPATQRLSDGEIFYTIVNGIRLTGMPAWGAGTPEDRAETWGLVHLIRHLRDITPEQLQAMKDLNPKTRAELEQEERERRFLEGE